MNGNRFCENCARRGNCLIQYDEESRAQCPLLDEDAPLKYRNEDGYADPTAFLALRNIEMERRKKILKQSDASRRSRTEYHDK